MITFWRYIQICLSALGAWLVQMLGGVNDIIVVLLALVCIDYATGVAKAISTKTLSSEIGFKGLARKAMILTIVALGNLVDLYLIKDGSVMRSACIFFYIANETISVIENLGALGVPMPQKLKEVLLQLKEKGE